jgi:NodT family efflux transporter outer membrane factor (OMF) lipoprotein
MCFKIKNTPSLKYLKTTSIISILSLVISGCAQIPSNKDLLKPNTISQYKINNSLSSTSNISWPKENWWEIYNDKQLNTLIEEALKDSPDVIAAMSRLKKADAFTQINNASNLPQVSANAQVTEEKHSYNYITPRSVTPKGWKDYGQVILNFGWELDFWGKNHALLAASISQVEAKKAELAQVRLTLSSAIASNYSELARLFAQKDELKQYLEVQSKLFTLLNQRLEHGLENKASTNDAKSLLAKTEGELLSLDEQISLERNKIASLLGAGPDRGLKINRPTINFSQNKFGLPKELSVNLLGRRPDIIAAKMQVESQRNMIEEKKAEFYPNINLSAFIGLQSLGLNLLHEKDSYMGSVGPAISLPIFTAGRLKGELRTNVSNYDEAVANYNSTLTQALKEVADAGTSQKSLTLQLLKSEEAFSSSTEAYNIKKMRYEGGISNYLEVLYAQENLINAKRNLTNLKSRAFTLDIALKYALGGGYAQKSSIIEKGN